MSLFEYSQRKSVRLALGVAALFIVFPVLFNIVFASKDEVSFAAGVGFSTCNDFFASDESGLSRCASSYNITLGNTGSNNQELITIDLSSVPEDTRLGWNVLDIVATSRRPIGPTISEQQLGDSLRLEIQDLEPNRLVEFTIAGRGIESAKQMEGITLSVQAEGTVIQTNPRLTVGMRFLRNLGGIFGF
ncbi:MAG: hypothetical protein DHS20C12_25160 [Pseudohongiella sp.]|nr:MAG: hypothetical protein DHS20C12_25160 [Pseudohongiella sp.]